MPDIEDVDPHARKEEKVGGDSRALTVFFISLAIVAGALVGYILYG